MSRADHHRAGYMLLEAICAMAVLSISMIAIHAGMRQAALTRAQARDYTQVRSLLQELLAAQEVQTTLFEGVKEGQYEGELDRFRWRTQVEYLPLPANNVPVVAPSRRGGRQKPVIQASGAMGRVTVSVKWTRGGREFSESLQTLVGQEKLYLPTTEAPR